MTHLTARMGYEGSCYLLLLLLLLLFKKVGSARDRLIHPIGPKTPAPQY